MKPLVSIIIVNWNGGDVLKECLTSLSKIKYPRYEIILVDNGSVSPPAKSKQYKLILNSTNLGFVGGNNIGYKETKGDYILLLNNDTKVVPDFLNILVEKIQSDKNIGVIQPKIYMMDKKGYLDNAGSFLTRIGFLEHWGFGQKDTKEFDKEKEIFSAKGACMLIRREVIEEVGLFDPDFVSYFEESDFCWRVHLAGYSVLFYPRTHIYHKVGFTIKRLDVANINFHYYKNRIRSLIKNLGPFNLLTILPIHLLLSLGIAVLFTIRGNIKNSVIILKAINWNIKHLKVTLDERSKIQKLRKTSDHELFSKLSRPVNFTKFFGDFKRVEKDLQKS